MAIRYDEKTKARAVRLVREHRNDYGSEWAAMRAIAGRLGMSAETLRKWVRQAEVDAGEAAACRPRRSGSCASCAANARSSSPRSKYSRPQHLSWRGSATRDTTDLRVHRHPS